MKYIAIIFWGFILGQVSVYLGSALSGGSYDFMIATMTGIFYRADHGSCFCVDAEDGLP